MPWDRVKILDKINDERSEQDRKYPDDDHLDDKTLNLILVEEVGEVSKAILENDNLEEELIQVAAVCVKWLEIIEKRKLK